MVTEQRARTLVTGGNPDKLFPVPPEEAFAEVEGPVEYIEAPDVERVAAALIGTCSEFSHLRERALVYLWRAEGGKTKGKATLGKCAKPSGLLKHFAEADFMVWLAADHVRGMQFSAWQVEALVYHELLHAGATDKGEPVLWPHDFEGFRPEVSRYGAWKPDLAEAAKSFQPRLPLADGPSLRDDGVEEVTIRSSINGQEREVHLTPEQFVAAPGAIGRSLAGSV